MSASFTRINQTGTRGTPASARRKGRQEEEIEITKKGTRQKRCKDGHLYSVQIMKTRGKGQAFIKGICGVSVVTCRLGQKEACRETRYGTSL